MDPFLSKHKKTTLSRINLNLSYTNTCGLRSNFPSVESFLKPPLLIYLLLSETNINDDIASSDFAVDGYLPLIRKDG